MVKSILIFSFLYFIILIFINFLFMKITSKKFSLYLIFNSMIFITINYIYFEINIPNIIHIFNTNFTLTILVFFIYAGLLKSISVKILLDIKNKNYNFQKYYEKFKYESFLPRVKILIDNKYLIKKKNNLYVTNKIYFVKKCFKIIHKLFLVRFSG